MIKKSDPTFTDLNDGYEAMKNYGIKDKDMEKAIRKQVKGMSQNEMKAYYQDFYSKRKR